MFWQALESAAGQDIEEFRKELASLKEAVGQVDPVVVVDEEPPQEPVDLPPKRPRRVPPPPRAGKQAEVPPPPRAGKLAEAEATGDVPQIQQTPKAPPSTPSYVIGSGTPVLKLPKDN
jgi:hypothetical protein